MSKSREEKCKTGLFCATSHSPSLIITVFRLSPANHLCNKAETGQHEVIC